MNLTENKTGWNFDNSYARLPNIFFANIRPTPVSFPKLVMLNQELAKDLGLNAEYLKSEDCAPIFAGNILAEGSEPIAQAYAGHQFGYFTMLGDGRAHLLGEQVTPKAESFDIQLKGSGKTPFSRGGDGRAALGPMVREYIISEAMHALGIETTRSLAVVTTGETVYRDEKLQGAILTRVASSHIRVGTFQFASVWGTTEDLRTLADYTIKRHFPEHIDRQDKYLCLLKEVIKRQASLVAKWQLVGFVHGVMNTDNMTISGETIDYGPCAFLDTYNPNTVFSSIDIEGRYAYGNQPSIAAWNLARFAETLLPLLNDESEDTICRVQDIVSDFSNLYINDWLSGMRAKLGLVSEEPEDISLIDDLLNLMYKHKADYTNTFASLTFDKTKGMEVFENEDFLIWHKNWKERLNKNPINTSAFKLMKISNPAVIPRNHRVEEALEAASHGDFNVTEKLLNVLAHPFAYSQDQEEYSKPPEPTACRYRTFCGT